MKAFSESSRTDRTLVYSWALVSDFRSYSQALHEKINEVLVLQIPQSGIFILIMRPVSA